MAFKLAVLNIVLDFSEIEVVVHESQISKLNWRLSVYSQNLYVNRWGVCLKKITTFIAVDLYTMQ